MSIEFEDRISTQALTLQDEDLAEEQVDSPFTPIEDLARPLTDILGNDPLQVLLEATYNRQQARDLVSLHYGHGGLAAGGRKRVDD